MVHQALYRQFRPQLFGDVVGQEHVSETLRKAVRDGSVVHAYLFSGPRGTGKTTNARILAKALNCTATVDGEPCNECESCVAVTENRSLDVAEMDAASNRGIDAMRELISRVALGSPGRWKVYIVDEVHMLTTDAATALLKTLEEPPSHVVFVLATTDPQKVLPTMRSRTQHFTFRLLPTDILLAHLRNIAEQAGLEVSESTIELAARRGQGSVRDALSALDQLAAAGDPAEADETNTTEVIEALAAADGARALLWVNERCMAGSDPRQLAGDLLAHLRRAFLATIEPGLAGAMAEDLEALGAQGTHLGRAMVVRAMTVLGEALMGMREAPDPRILLEVGLLRLCCPEMDTTTAALLQRIERLEAGGAGAASTATASEAATAAPPRHEPAPTSARSSAAPGRPAPPPAAPRIPPAATPLPSPDPAPAAVASAPPAEAPAPPAAPGDQALTVERVGEGWAAVFDGLSQRVRARYRPGRFERLDGDVAHFVVPDVFHLDRCADPECKAEVERALSSRLGQPLRLHLRAKTATTPEQPPSAAPSVPPAPPVTSAARILEAFEGAEVVGGSPQ